jgi:two-component system, chemotaxis family, chemotaxis protein CheY
VKILIVEDDFVTRRLLQSFLSPYGTCDITVNGLEAIKAFSMALEEKTPYDLVCLDILMPEMDGQEVLKEIRQIEKELGINDADGVKIIMVSILSDVTNIKAAMEGQCEAFIPKPIEKQKLLEILRNLNLINK